MKELREHFGSLAYTIFSPTPSRKNYSAVPDLAAGGGLLHLRGRGYEGAQRGLCNHQGIRRGRADDRVALPVTRRDTGEDWEVIPVKNTLKAGRPALVSGLVAYPFLYMCVHFPGT